MGHKGVLKNHTIHITTGNVVSDLEDPGLELPLLGLVKGRGVDTTGDEDAGRGLLNGLKGTLDSVENVLHDTRAKLNREGLPGPEDGVTNSQTSWGGEGGRDRVRCGKKKKKKEKEIRTSLLVDLNGGSVLLKTNDLTDQLVVTNTDLVSKKGERCH